MDADLGGWIIKQRMARTGQGRSGGYRLLIAYRSGKRAVFLYGFAKSERDNIEADELETLKEIGAAWLEAKKERLEYANELPRSKLRGIKAPIRNRPFAASCGELTRMRLTRMRLKRGF